MQDWAQATWLSDYSYPAAPQVPVVSARTIARRRSVAMAMSMSELGYHGIGTSRVQATPSQRIKAVGRLPLDSHYDVNENQPVHASHLHLPFSSSSSASASCCGVSYLAATSISLAQLVCILAKPSRLWLDTTTTPTGLKPPPSGVLTAKPPAAWNRPKSLRLSGTHTVRFNFHNYACKSAMFVGISLAFSFGILLRVAHTRPPYSISARNKPS